MTEVNINKKELFVTYAVRNTTHIFEINSKELKVYETSTQDDQFSQYDHDYELDPNDKAKLTTEELEVFEDDPYEYLNWEAGDKETLKL